MIDDLALDAVTWVRQRTHQRLVSVPVAGLAGDVQQRLGRSSYEIELRGTLVGEGAKDALATLQGKAAAGEEVAFVADIVTALEIAKVVVVDAAFEEAAGRAARYDYRLVVRESPPLPEPAELDLFGGLDGVDLGFDTDVLGDIADLAAEVQGAIEKAGDVLNDLKALASLGDLSLGNPVSPIQEEAATLASVGSAAGKAAAALGRLLG